MYLSSDLDYITLWAVNTAYNNLINRLQGKGNAVNPDHPAEEEAVYIQLKQYFDSCNYMQGCTDWEKVRAITRYLWANSTYDRPADRSTYVPYDLIINKKGKCEEYARVFMLMARVVGLDCYYTKSDIHTWNKVNIDGDWYNVDVTQPAGGGWESIDFTKSICFTDAEAQSGYTRSGFIHPGYYYNNTPYGIWPPCTATKYTFTGE